jgi:hypothetical protein
MRHWRGILAVALVGLLVASAASAWLLPSAQDVARVELAEAGFQPEALTLVRSEWGGGPLFGVFNQSALVEFRERGRAGRTVRVRLRRLAYFLPWRAEDPPAVHAP